MGIELPTWTRVSPGASVRAVCIWVTDVTHAAALVLRAATSPSEATSEPCAVRRCIHNVAFITADDIAPSGARDRDTGRFSPLLWR
ncbi:MAG: hypothetical protein Tsb0020_48020 [Haliangiales bacterium]